MIKKLTFLIFCFLAQNFNGAGSAFFGNTRLFVNNVWENISRSNTPVGMKLFGGFVCVFITHSIFEGFAELSWRLVKNYGNVPPEKRPGWDGFFKDCGKRIAFRGKDGFVSLESPIKTPLKILFAILLYLQSSLNAHMAE